MSRPRSAIEPIDYVMTLGTITKIAMENLIAQMEGIDHKASGARIELANIEPGQIAVVAVSPGAGISRVFASLGVAAIVEGGQTMNPCTKDILDAFENLPTEKVIILPNNKNIILAAQQAKDVTVKKVCVVPSHSIPQGLAAMMQLNPDGELEAVAAKMTKAIEDVTTIEVTTATRTVEIDGVSVEQGQVIALVNGKLAVSAATVEEACLGALAYAHADDHELITLFHGEGLPISGDQPDRGCDPGGISCAGNRIAGWRSAALSIYYLHRIADIAGGSDLRQCLMPNICILTDSTVQFTHPNFPGHERVYIIPFEIQNMTAAGGCTQAWQWLCPKD